MNSTEIIGRHRVIVFLALLTVTFVPRAIASADDSPPTTLMAAVLPSSRSVQVGHLATALATIINAGQNLATDCRISPLTNIPATFFYSDLSYDYGSIDIPAGQAHRFVFGVIPHAPIAPTDVQLSFTCANTAPAPIFTEVNTFLLSASATLVADIVAMASTPSNDGIVRISVGQTPGSGAFAVATMNIGADDNVTVSADTGAAILPLSISICQTDPKTSLCLSSPEDGVTTEIRSNETPTFGIFVTATGDIGFLPASNRIFVRFNDSDGVTRGSTSVAVWTFDPNCCPWDY